MRRFLLLRMFSNRWVMDPSTLSVPSDSSLWWMAVTQKSELISTVKDCDRKNPLKLNQINHNYKYKCIKVGRNVGKRKKKKMEKVPHTVEKPTCTPLRQEHFQFQEPKVKQ